MANLLFSELAIFKRVLLVSDMILNIHIAQEFFYNSTDGKEHVLIKRPQHLESDFKFRI